MREECLLTGPLEPTNEWYAIAKIAGIKLCQAYRRQYGFNAISLMPTNLYGPGDNFDLQNSHVLPALIRRFHEARERRRRRGGGLGHGHAAARVPARRRPGRRLRVPDARLRRRRAGQRRVGRGRHASASWPRWSPRWSASRAGSPSTPPSRTARRASCSTPAGSTIWAGGPQIPLETGVAATYRWFLDQPQPALPRLRRLG